MERISRVVKLALKHLKDSSGATLYEITAAVAMAGILAAVAAPIVIERVGEAKVSATVTELDTFWAGMQNFQSHTGKWPGEAEGVFVLVSSTGIDLPDNAETAINVTGVSISGLTCTAGCRDINSYLVTDPNPSGVSPKPYPEWQGPYTGTITKDPFDRAYVINVAPLFRPEPAEGGGGTCGYAWIISGSSDRFLSTKLKETTLDALSDDIGKNRGKKVGAGAGCS